MFKWMKDKERAACRKGNVSVCRDVNMEHFTPSLTIASHRHADVDVGYIKVSEKMRDIKNVSEMF